MGVPFPLNFPLIHGDIPVDVVTCDVATMVLTNNGSVIYWGFLQSLAAKRREQQTSGLNLRQDIQSSLKDPSRPKRIREWTKTERRTSMRARRDAMIGAEDLPRAQGMALTYHFPSTALVRSIHAYGDTMVVVFHNDSIGALGKRWVDSAAIIDWNLPYYNSLYESSFGRPVEISVAKGQFVALIDNQANGGSWNLLHVTTNVQHYCPGISWFESFPNISYCNMTSANVNIDLSSVKQIVILEDNVALDMLALLHTGQIYHIILTSITGKRDKDVDHPTELDHYNPIRHFLEDKRIKARRKRGIQSTELFDYPGLPPPYSIKKLLAFGSTELQVLTTDGKLFLSDTYTPMEPWTRIANEPSPLRLLPTSYFIHDIGSAVSMDLYLSPGVQWRPTHVMLASPRPGVVQSPAPQQARLDDFDTIAIGDDFACNFGDGQCLPFMDFLQPSSHGMPRRLLPDHPINSKTSLVSVDSMVILTDGFTPDGRNRTIRWGGQPDLPGTYMRSLNPFYTRPQLIDPIKDASLRSYVVKSVAVGYSEIHIYNNCSLVISLYAYQGPFYDVFVTNPSLLSSPDSAYKYRVGPWSYPTQVYPDDFHKDQCVRMHGERGVSVADMKCANMNYRFAPDGTPSEIHCLIIMTNGSLFSFGIHSTSPGYACEGLFGEPQRCFDETVQNYISTSRFFVGLHLIDTSPPSALYQKTVTQISLGARHAIALTLDGTVASWGSNGQNQLGLTPGDSFTPFTDPPNSFGKKRNIEETLVLHEPGIPIRVTFPTGVQDIVKVVTSSYSSYAITRGDEIYAWGSNSYGELGIGRSVYEMGSTSTPTRTLFNASSPISDMACNRFTCYVLQQDGSIFSWGLAYAGLLGRPVPTMWTPDPTPRLATLLSGDSTWKNHQLITGPTAVSLFVRRMRQSQSGCVGSPPTPQFWCIDGVWAVRGDVTIGPGTSTPSIVTITGPVYIDGNLTLAPGGAIEVHPDPGSITSNPGGRPYLNVSGCLVLDGEVTLVIDPATWRTIKTKLDGRQVFLAESSCSMLSSSKPQPVTSPKDCRKLKSDLESKDQGNGRFGLVSTFTVDSSRCSRWWIILVSVLGAAAILAIIGLLTWTYIRKRQMKSPVSAGN
jgi:hypothetical protein